VSSQISCGFQIIIESKSNNDHLKKATLLGPKGLNWIFGPKCKNEKPTQSQWAYGTSLSICSAQYTGKKEKKKEVNY
jgi:hypothetical protein